MSRITIFILLISSPFSFGQLLQSRISESRVLDETLNHALLGALDDRLFSISEDKEEMYMDVYALESLSLIHHEQIRLIEKDKYDLEIEGVYRVRDEFKLVATGFSTGSNQFAIFIYTILENGKLDEHFQRTLFTERSQASYSVLTDVQTSPDKSSLMVHVAFVSQFGDHADHYVRVYDQKLAPIFKTDYASFPKSTMKQKHQLTYYLGNEHLYELQQEVSYNKSVKKHQAGLRFRKFGFKANDTIHTRALTLPDGYLLSDMRMQEAKDNLQLFASYLGTSKKTIIGIRGVYTAELSSDLTVNYSKSKAFSAGTKAKSLKGYEEPELLDVPLLYGLNSCIKDSKGNTYMLYERASQTSSGGLTEYYYGSIIAVKITPEGNVEWDNFIAKSQFFKERGIPIIFVAPGFLVATPFAIRLSKDTRQYLSFKTIMKNDELYFLYNDNPANEGRTAGQGRENMMNVSQSVPFVIHLSPTGDVDYQALKHLKVDSDIQRIIYSVLNGTSMFTLRDYGKKEVLQRIEFE
ncbi:hypothetical protein [uncultured Fluviicola sp.]|uniref:hypothetical protein n=1 Tax=uncultured Fluviicola sp. TaxID=463303 RepID=UPI0025D09537|nr:hypothetical protein [uncultured Fluviicola sp.]